MSKINLITLVVKPKGNCLYQHHMSPGEDGAIYTSAASGGYVSGVYNVIDAIRVYDPHVVAAVVTPWDDDDGRYEICFSVSKPTASLLKLKELALAPEGFWKQEWRDEWEFLEIVPESEIASRLDGIQALVKHWNEQLG